MVAATPNSRLYVRIRFMLPFALRPPAVRGSAEAVLPSGRQNVDVIGLSLTTVCKAYIHNGSVQSIVLWNTRDRPPAFLPIVEKRTIARQPEEGAH